MACLLVALDKRPRLRPVEIGETLCQAIVKLFMRVAGDQAKSFCGSLQLCPGLEAGIEGATHAMAQMRWENTAPALGESYDEYLYEWSAVDEANDGR